MDILSPYAQCKLCARACGVDRTDGKIGFCRSTDKIKITRIDLHHWEEPIISGDRGSGTVFFSGCSLGCVYCQNARISRSSVGIEYTPEALAAKMIELEKKGAHNINFVTPTHFTPSIIEAVGIARSLGLSVPIVYNTGSYDTVDTVRTLENTVDIYLPDLKYYRPKTAKSLSYAGNYPDVARSAIAEMVRQRPTPVIEEGIMRSGVIVRVLLLPSHVAEAKLSVKHLHEAYGNSIYISLMNQYTPMPGMTSPLNRTVTNAEYSELVSYAERIGVVNAFIQEGGTQSESFIPEFTL
jgi:putative pyruvate formate lyase activating enzyme